MQKQNVFGRVVSLAGVLWGLCPAAEAADAHWVADADGNWADAGNWEGGVPGSASALDSADAATFGWTLTGDRLVTVDGNRNIRGILFANTNGYAYTLSGGPLLLSDGGTLQNAADSGDHADTVSAEIAMQGDGGKASFVANAASANSILSFGAVSGAAVAGHTNTLLLAGTNTGGNAVSGVVSDGVGGGRLALLKIGSGTWVLGGSNTFGGAVNVATGVLVAAHSSALGVAPGAVTVASNAVLGLQGGIAVSNRTATLEGGGLANRGALANVGGTNTWTGNLTALGATPRINSNAGRLLITGNVAVQSGSGNFTLGGAGEGEISGVISGSRTLFRSSSDAGTWILGGTNTYSGDTTVGNGTIAISHARNLGAARTVAKAAAITLGGSSARGTLRTMADLVLTNFYGVTLHNAGGVIRTDSGTTFTLNGIVSDRTTAPYGGPLTKSGSGTLVLNAVNTFSNMLEVAEGKVVLGRANALFGRNGNPPKLKVDDLLDLGGFSVTNPVLTGAGGTVSNGTLCVTRETSAGGSGAVSSLALPDVTLQGVLTADVGEDGSCDRLNVAGGLTLSGLSLNVVDTGHLSHGQTYTLAACEGGSLSGRFSGHNLPDGWWIDYSGGNLRLKYFAGMLMSVR